MSRSQPRWTVTCPAGHVTSRRADVRPKLCAACDAAVLDDAMDPPSVHSRKPSQGRKRASGDAALFTRGDGRQVSRSSRPGTGDGR